MNTKQVLGTITIVAVIGGVTYGIIKARKNKKAEEESISMEEAMDLVKDREPLKTSFQEDMERNRNWLNNLPDAEKAELRKKLIDENNNVKYETPSKEDMEKLIEGGHVTVGPIEVDGVPHSFVVQPYKEEPYVPEEEDEEEEEIVIDYFPEDHGRPLSNTITEEDKELRHHPDSVEALQQYMRMELAEWAITEDTYQTMARLFDFPFEPITDGDKMLRTQIIDQRVRFFGFSSRWAQQVTFAEVILHYAKNAQFNCDETVRYWTEYFLEYIDIFHAYSSKSIDEVIHALNTHTYYNNEKQSYGLFGLTQNCIDQAIRIAERNIDNSLTYEIEFQEFLKSMI